MGLINDIKKDIAKSGQSKSKILYVREKTRIRFLQELDDGYSFTFHDKFDEGINCLCPKEIDEDNECIYCGDENVRARKLYAWSIYNFDTKEVQVALFAVNQCTPVSQLINMSESYGTIMDRDYVLVRTGKQTSTSYTVIPQDKQKFRNSDAKPLSRAAILKILKDAFPYNSDDEEEEETKTKTKDKKKKFEALDDETPPWEEKKKKNKNKKESKEESTELSIDYMEEELEENDIDIDEFCEFHEIKSLKKITSKSKKEFKNMVKEYLEALDDDDDEDDDDEFDEDDE